MRFLRWPCVLGVVLGFVGSAALGQAVGGPTGAGSTVGELPAPPPGPDVRVIPDVPSYIWYHGCGPTAIGMILGYWDGHGFGNLIPGPNDWNTNQQAIQDMISSPGHIADYALYDGVDDSNSTQWPHSLPYPDLSEIDPAAAHADDCVADFAKCSWSAEGLKHGWSYLRDQDNGLRDYAEQRGYVGSTAGNVYFNWLWDEFVASIDAGRPAELLVDTDGNGSTDHFIAAIGYDKTPGELKYACYTTWDHNLRWFAFQSIGGGRRWGVYAGTFFEPVPEPAMLTPLALLAVLLRGRRR